MKNKGFTLIELLAVITILSVLALITVVLVNNTIKSAKAKIYENCVIDYTRALKGAISLYDLDNQITLTGETTNINSDGSVVTFNNISLNIEYTGNKVKCESILVRSNGTVKVTNCIVADTSDKITYDEGGDTSATFIDGTAVYFDVVNSTKCTNYHEDNSKTGYNGIYQGTGDTHTTANQNSCLKFYVFNDTETSETVNLILDHNTTSTVAWVLKTDYNDDDNWTGNYNSKGPITALKQLNNDTISWKGTVTPENYIDREKNYTIDYSNYKARLITAQEIAQITKNTSWNNISFYYLDTNSQTPTAKSKGESSYAWLYDYTYDCESNGCNISDSSTYGYWTASASASYVGAWQVRSSGYLGYNISVRTTSSLGIRPVITVLKSLLIED